MSAPGDGYALPRRARVRRRPEYLAVQERGRRVAGPHFLLFALRGAGPRRFPSRPRLGVTVSRKVGNAVVRNRVKRWIKEVARHWLPAAPRDIDVVVVARSEAGNLAPARARTEIDGLLRRLDSAR